MAEVTYLHPYTRLPVPVHKVLDGARDCTEVLVLGTAADASFYAAASTNDVALVVWWLERFKHALLSGEYA